MTIQEIQKNGWEFSINNGTVILSWWIEGKLACQMKWTKEEFLAFCKKRSI